MKQSLPPSKKAKTNIISTKLLVGICVGAVGIAISLYLYLTSPFSPRNLAAEVAKPLEEALIKAGGVKKCDGGDPGFGGDNWKPWYEGVYQVQVGRLKAVEIIKTIGGENGFDLKADRSTDDVDTEISFRDQTSRRNLYSELKDGPLYVSGTINRYGDDLRCGGDPLISNENQTIVRINISLPERKR